MNAITRSDPQVINVFGSQEVMDFMLARAAAIFQVPAEDMQYPDVQGSLLKAAQLCWTYGAMPGRHVWLIPFNKSEKVGDKKIWRKTYAVADSYEWRKASADLKANRDGLRYVVQTAEMTPAEVREYVTSNKMGGTYCTEDRGVKARVLLAHEIKIMADAKAIGLKMAEYEPAWHFGFWRKEALWKEASSKWEADTVPAGRTRDWVALKRSEKSALAEHFELCPLHGWESKSAEAKLAAVEDATPATITVDPHAHAFMGPRCTDAEMNEFLNGDEPVTGNYEEVDFTAAKVTQPAAAPTVAPSPAPAAQARYPESWSQPRHAHAWAVANGFCKNEFEARGSWMKIIGDYGIFSRANATEVYQSYYERQLTKGTEGRGA